LGWLGSKFDPSHPNSVKIQFLYRKRGKSRYKDIHISFRLLDKGTYHNRPCILYQMHLYYCLHNIKHKNYANSKWKNKRTEEKDITTLSISENREIDRRSKLSIFKEYTISCYNL
jgi:hypothetical protein